MTSLKTESGSRLAATTGADSRLAAPVAIGLLLAWMATAGVGYAIAIWDDVRNVSNPSVDTLMPAYGLMLAGIVFALVTGSGKKGMKDSGEGGVRNGG